MQVSTVHSDKDLESGQARDRPVGVLPAAIFLALRHPGFTVKANLPELGWLKVRVCIFRSQFPGSLYTHAFIHKLLVSQRQRSEKNVRGTVGWVTVPHSYRIRSKGANPR